MSKMYHLAPAILWFEKDWPTQHVFQDMTVLAFVFVNTSITVLDFLKKKNLEGKFTFIT